MSRIPVPSHSPSQNRSAGANRAASPIPFPADRALSPLPPSRHHTNASMSALSGSAADTRKKQNRRDEAIRKKIESELSRKRTISTTQHQSGAGGRRRGNKPNVQKGTVAALKPSPALTVPENITVSEASQLCAAKRTDCVLVVDDDEGLSGIFTAKDLAYRVTAEGLDPHVTPVSQIMTRNPMVTRDTTSATEALQLMVQKHFRHLPVCNEEGNVVGLLDITKVFHEALDKVERSSSASEKLYSALAGVQSELGAGLAQNPQAAAMLSYVEALREKTALPELTSVMDSRTQPATVGPKTTVRDVAKLMKERRTTAVCVMEPAAPGQAGAPKIAGIFTSKDIVLRVIAAGLDASRCSVVRVMTPHPDTAPPTMTIHDALKKMYTGHYLNLPVVEADGRLVAIVDVLKLTYATLEQMNSMSQEAAGETDGEGGPMWGRFFESLGANEDTESMVSGSHYQTDTHSQSRRLSRSMSHLVQSPHSEVHPNDSASVVDDDNESALAGYPKNGENVPSIVGPPASIPPVDDGTQSGYCTVHTSLVLRALCVCAGLHHTTVLVCSVLDNTRDTRQAVVVSSTCPSSSATPYPMPKRERDEAVAQLSSTIFSEMLEEILMDVVQQAHKEIARARAVCDICHTRCNAVHVPGPSNGAAGSSRVPTPNGDTQPADGNSPAATGSNTPVNGKDGTAYFECLECKRPIASNRYAPHLSSCMGIGNRRGAARNATAKSKLGSDFGKSASPRLASEAAQLSDDGGKAPPYRRARARRKRRRCVPSEDVIINSNGKRTASPSISPVKKSKKQKTAAAPAGRVKLDPDSPLSASNLLPHPSTASRVPSRLRESSIASSFQRDRRSSSPDSPRSSPARSISTQASAAIRSPAISSATIKTKQTNGKGRGAPAQPRLPSPPRPPPPPVPIIRMPDTDYLVDVEGEETGSSTDTDSD
ncbi:hypothetical protein BN946_scf184977.g149 [Trametes cinnabarina]|uniref:SAGA-associated factor 11 n=1 Tax=Pycnoporus cinnabarinus TaxID=5643 RepID=A0A060SJ38_PYCCI|nr:hypothetical protein BN946_scf184977.g149 [Trametes cinnabarina]